MQMEHFDFDAPAEVFIIVRVAGGSRRMTFLKFPSGAGAVKHVVEELDDHAQRGSIVEIEEARFDFAAVAQLYESPRYPLQRRKNPERREPAAKT